MTWKGSLYVFFRVGRRCNRLGIEKEEKGGANGPQGTQYNGRERGPHEIKTNAKRGSRRELNVQPLGAALMEAWRKSELLGRGKNKEPT